MNTKKILLSLFLSGMAYTASAQEIKKETRGEQEYIVYKVQKGETVFSISKKYGIKPDDLITHNPAVAKVIKADDMVYIPLILKNPKAEPSVMRGDADAPEEVQITYTKHKVAKGQGLMAIARMYNISVDELKKWNDLDEAKPSIDPDQELIVGISTSKSSKKNKETRTETANNNPKSTERNTDKPAIKKTETNKSEKMRGDDDMVMHEVVKGETLYKIAQMYGLTELDIMNENSMEAKTVKTGEKIKIVNPKKKPTLPAQQPTGNPEKQPTENSDNTNATPAYVIYSVVQGDNLKKIQDKFNASREEIRYWNGMPFENTSDASKNIINIGDQLKIYLPKELKHTIQKGETIESVKKQYNIRADRAIEKWNNIPKGKLKEAFMVGKTLNIFQPTGPLMTEGYINGTEPPLQGLTKQVAPVKKEEQANPTVSTVKVKHTVKDDQTLYEIAKIYKVNVEDIKKWNNITDALKPSQVLDIYVPADKAPANNTNANNNTNNNTQPKPANNTNTTPEVKENNFNKDNGNNMDLSDFHNQPLPKEQPKKEEPKKEVPKKDEQPKNDAPTKEVTTEATEAMKGLAQPTQPEKVQEPVENAYTNPNANGNLTSPPTESKVESGDVVETGIAEVLTSVVSPYPNVATHKTIPTGSVIMIKNPINKKTITAQIVAPLNDTSNPNTIIQVTRAIMEKLGVPDDKTVEVEITHYKR